MTAWPRLLLIPIALGTLLLDPGPSGFLGVREASAQLSPNQLPQPGVPSPTVKTEGVAEQATEGPDQLPTTPVIPQTRNKRKRFELFELDGYYRLRTDWFKNFHLGFNDYQGQGVPFPQPLGCQRINQADDMPSPLGPCEDSIKGANMRLRLEPTININETTRVFLQVDLLDNIVLGSTPELLAAGSPDHALGAFSGNQAPPEAERAVRVRRAWAEVETSLGQISFGRQPWQWGTGIYANAGGADPFSGTYDLDSDYGDTVDRVMFRTTIPGTPIEAAIATDWALTYPGAAQDPLYIDRYGGQPWDLEDNDDISQWVVMLSRFDKPELFAENIAKGELAVNYGAFVAYRTQDWPTGVPTPEPIGPVRKRGLKTYTPDVWAKLGLGPVTMEIEGVGTIGSIENVSDIELPDSPGLTESIDIRRFGAVGRINYRALQDKLNLGFEVGFASGDRWDNVPAGSTHVRYARPLAAGVHGEGISDTTLKDFRFNFDYDVDLILFRELIGTVANATYLKPNASYLITDQIQAKAQGIISFANNSEATPGDSSMYGVEVDADVAYRSGAFTLGVAGGILFPLGAMAHDVEADFGTLEDPGASTAYTVQTRLSLQF